MAQPDPSDPLYDLDDRTDPEFAAIHAFVLGDLLEPPTAAIHNFEKFKERRSPDRICRAARQLQEQNRGAEVLAYVRDLLGIMRPALPTARRKRERIIEAHLAGLKAKERKTQQVRIERGNVRSPLKETFALLSEATDLVVSRAAKVVSWLRYEELPCLAPLNDHHPELIAGVTGVISGHATEQNWVRIEAAYATADIARQRRMPMPHAHQHPRPRKVRLSDIFSLIDDRDERERKKVLNRWRTRFRRRDTKLMATGDNGATRIATDGTLPLDFVAGELAETGDIRADLAVKLNQTYPGGRVVIVREKTTQHHK